MLLKLWILGEHVCHLVLMSGTATSQGLLEKAFGNCEMQTVFVIMETVCNCFISALGKLCQHSCYLN